jgi:hypothetical protein
MLEKYPPPAEAPVVPFAPLLAIFEFFLVTNLIIRYTFKREIFSVFIKRYARSYSLLLPFLLFYHPLVQEALEV